MNINTDEDFDDGDTLLFTVPEDAAGTRLDKFLGDTCPDLSRSRLKALILAGEVTLDGQRATTPSAKIKADTEIAVTVPPPVDDTPQPQNIPLDIVYEDDSLLVINKPAGLVVHPGAGNHDGTLVNALLYHCADSLSGIGGVKRPGIVHRLDKDTSGLMVAAKTDEAHQGLSEQLSDRTLSRVYSAIVWGVLPPGQGTVDQPIGRHLTQRQKMTVTSRNSREAVTHYRTIERLGPQDAPAACLVECKLETGRTHQIRVHMAHIGHALVGDPLYGAQDTAARAYLRKGGYSEENTAAILSFPRQALHARAIAFIHPVSGEEMHFEAEAPADFQTLLQQLK
ncbi:MAG: RluA family pseudouridine synthase [Rhodospirillales bacterium]|nr:RluA family pseudouridine synthase [Rhodospirillales bacterium]